MRLERAKITLRGAVQGVGFRPHVYRLALELGLKGWVINASAGVLIEVEGPSDTLREFLLRLENEKPPRAVLQGVEFSFLDPVGYDRFEIRFSDERGSKTVLICPMSPPVPIACGTLLNLPTGVTDIHLPIARIAVRVSVFSKLCLTTVRTRLCGSSRCARSAPANTMNHPTVVFTPSPMRAPIVVPSWSSGHPTERFMPGPGTL